MDQAMDQNQRNTLQYWAFISYSHQDKRWGKWLHQCLERYRVPKQFVDTESRGGKVPHRLFPVFRDEEELPTSSSLASNIKDALMASRYLIVICSPRSAQSRWVNEEIKIFKAIGREDRILCLIVDGEPNASDKPSLQDNECFAEALRYSVAPDGAITDERTEPIAADVRPGHQTNRDALLKLIAGLLGINYGVLNDREHRRHVRQLQTITLLTAVVLMVTLGLAVLALFQRNEAERQRKEAEQGRRQAEMAREAEQEQRDEAERRRVEAEKAKEAEKQRRIEAERRLYCSYMRMAGNYLQQDQVVLANKTLWLVPEQYREWEWGYLLLQTNAELAVLKAHRFVPASASFSADGTVVMTVSGDSARLWDSTSRKDLGTLQPKEGERIETALLSPDGRQVVTAMANGVVRVWDASSGKNLRALINPTNQPFTSAALSPDGSRIAATAMDGMGRVWDSASGKTVAVLDAAAVLGKTQADLQGQDGVPAYGASFSPDGTRILTLAGDHSGLVWDAASGRKISVLRGHQDRVESALFSPDGKKIVTASLDKTARLWDSASGKELAVLRGHDGMVHSASFSPDGTRIVTASGDATARVWEAASGKELYPLRGHKRAVVSASFSPDGHEILTASVDTTARIWGENYVQLAVLRHEYLRDVQPERPFGGLTSACFSPDGTRVVTTSEDMTARVWDVNSGRQELEVLLAREGKLSLSDISPDGTRILTVQNENNTVRVCEAATKEELAVLQGHEQRVISQTFSPDGTKVVTTSADMTARVWDAGSGKEQAVLRGHERHVHSASFSVDGTRIATASADKTARIWDAVSGKELAVLRGHEDMVVSAAFSPDGRQVVTASADATARIWDAGSGEERAVMRGHEAPLYWACYSPDGQRVVTTAGDNTVRLWDVAIGQEMASLPYSAGGSYISVAHFDHNVVFSRDGLQILPVKMYGIVPQMWIAAPFCKADLPGDDSMSWKDRFDLWKQRRYQASLACRDGHR